MYDVLSKELQLRSGMGWTRVDWSLAAPLSIRNLSIVRARLAAAPWHSGRREDLRRDDDLYVQLTCELRSKQYFAAYG